MIKHFFFVPILVLVSLFSRAFAQTIPDGTYMILKINDKAYEPSRTYMISVFQQEYVASLDKFNAQGKIIQQKKNIHLQEQSNNLNDIADEKEKTKANQYITLLQTIDKVQPQLGKILLLANGKPVIELQAPDAVPYTKSSNTKAATDTTTKEVVYAKRPADPLSGIRIDVPVRHIITDKDTKIIPYDKILNVKGIKLTLAKVNNVDVKEPGEITCMVTEKNKTLVITTCYKILIESNYTNEYTKFQQMNFDEFNCDRFTEYGITGINIFREADQWYYEDNYWVVKNSHTQETVHFLINAK